MRIPGCVVGCSGSAALGLEPGVSMVDLNTLSLGFFIRKMEEQCLWRLAWRVPEVGKGSHARGAVGGLCFFAFPPRDQGASQGPAGGTPGGPRKPCLRSPIAASSPWIQHSRMSLEASSIED